MNERYYDGNSEDLPGEEYIEEPIYRPPAYKKSGRPAWILIPLVGVGLVVLAMLIVWFWEKPLTEGPEKRMQLLEKRIENLESQIVRLNELNEKWVLMENQNQELQSSLERIARMETSINRRIDELRRDMNALGKIPTSASSEKPQSAETSASKPASGPASPDQTTAGEKPVIHRVKAGDTLYSISRQYGISVEELRRKNDLQNNTIGIGQELRIR